MTMHHDTHIAVPPTAGGDRRAVLLGALGLDGVTADPQLDAFATQLAAAAGVPYAMVNLVGPDQQRFVGLCTPPDDQQLPPVDRQMSLEHGYCPEVVRRRKALPLPDVCAHPRFSANAVVDLIGIRTYAGAPLIYQGGVLGTVCFVGREPRPQSVGRDYLELIKSHRDAVLDYLVTRAATAPPALPGPATALTGRREPRPDAARPHHGPAPQR
ncbi:GAF domain-containing protein [Streptomyces sp. PTM05]|uniref:GAF domain-containing protein n=1 Tax=Streptantibioticus parmotrematis TaxID=2873249 RepID=A0ABS7QVM5_9ACTN|nr:GAF domain-containing protein [Streptantibioticus parmotrematis]MBY8887278.1 GAF domain-containing protein [Streptantibioticus parmotrematis]